MSLKKLQPVILFLLSALPLAQEAAGDVELVRLRDGRILWGSIVEHEPDSIQVHRLETDGTVRLPWSMLDPAEEKTLKTRFGYVDTVAEEVMTQADRLTLTDGSEIVGLIVRRSDEHVYVKRADSTVPVAKRLISGAATIVQVPALEIFTREELYQQKVFELQGALQEEGTLGAQANFELARYCESLFDFANAARHYRFTAEADPAFEPDVVSASIARAELKASLQEQVDHLAQIDLWRARKRYDRALELVATFPNLYPQSPLMDDWIRMRDRVRRYQERELREQVVRRSHSWATKLARQAAREIDSYEGVLDYLDEKMAEDLLEGVHKDLLPIAPDIELPTVRRLWDERTGGRYRQASYGLATWLLGKDKAQARLEEEEEEEEVAEGSQAEARRELEARLRRYYENQTLARQAKSGGGALGEDPETFWESLNSGARSSWILAYFVENSGLFRIERIRFAPCRDCGGTGGKDVIFSGAAMVGGQEGGRDLVPCATCHTVKIVRRVRYR